MLLLREMLEVRVLEPTLAESRLHRLPGQRAKAELAGGRYLQLSSLDGGAYGERRWVSGEVIAGGHSHAAHASIRSMQRMPPVCVGPWAWRAHMDS